VSQSAASGERSWSAQHDRTRRAPAARARHPPGTCPPFDRRCPRLLRDSRPAEKGIHDDSRGKHITIESNGRTWHLYLKKDDYRSNTFLWRVDRELRRARRAPAPRAQARLDAAAESITGGAVRAVAMDMLDAAAVDRAVVSITWCSKEDGSTRSAPLDLQWIEEQRRQHLLTAPVERQEQLQRLIEASRGARRTPPARAQSEPSRAPSCV
jgi:hypothetical protein